MARQPGFLTKADREKLRGKQDMDEYSNVSQWKGRVRESLAQAYRDKALLEESSLWDDEDHMKVLRETHKNTPLTPPLSEDDIDRGISVMLAEAKTYEIDLALFLADELEDISESEEIEKEIQKRITEDMRPKRKANELRKMFAHFVVKEWLDTFSTGNVSRPDEVVEDLVDIWPDRDTMRSEAEKLTSD